MKYLLNTHSFLWFLFEDKKLSKKVRNILENNENEIYVSIITFWEISLKYNLGKIEFQNFTPEFLPSIAKKTNIITLELLENEAATFYKLPRKEHKDPFDRLLVWQAINRNIPILSKDKAISAYQEFGLNVLWK